MRVNTIDKITMVLVILVIFTLVVALYGEEIVLPTHGDKDEQEIIHSLSLSATLFPEALAIWAEMQFMNIPCGCECGQAMVDCNCELGGGDGEKYRP